MANVKKTSKKRKNRTEAEKATMRKNTEARKAKRREAQSLAEARNRALRADGQPTPWEAARAARKGRRAGLGEEAA